MASLIQHARRGFVWPFPNEGLEQYTFGGNTYFGLASSAFGAPDKESPPSGFAQLAQSAFAANSIVFACELKRMQIFSEARFVYRAFSSGRPGRLFSLPDLEILKSPWPRGTTGDLLSKMILDADLGGNAYVARSVEGPDRLRMLRPDYVTIVMGDRFGRPVQSPWQIDAEIIGFIYAPQDESVEAETLLAEDIAHFAPVPDPLARFRGMSWLTPAVREIQADQSATMHKLAFFENGATPQLVVSFDATVTEEQFRSFVATMDDKHTGWRNAYKTIYLGGGATPTVVGKDLQQLDFSKTQGKGETRIIADAGLHPVLVPSSEGMQGSSLNAGNYAAARRSVADTTFRPLWRNVAGSLAPIVPPPSGSELWYDETGIAFLREDAKDIAEIQRVQASAVRLLADAGWTPDAAVQFVQSNDLASLLGEHSGLFSVQLQPPGTQRQVIKAEKPLAITAGQPRSRALTARKFNPDQPRNPHSGEWVGLPGVDFRDPNKLAAFVERLIEHDGLWYEHPDDVGKQGLAHDPDELPDLRKSQRDLRRQLAEIKKEIQAGEAGEAALQEAADELAEVEKEIAILDAIKSRRS